MGETFIKILAVLAILLLFVIVFAGLSWIFQILWNFAIPSIFHGPVITFNQAVALTLLLNFVGGAFKTTNKSS